ncbi:MAG: 50S ribosomal protein L19 [Deltaproteobacteria bacterium]|nr:50S ribosomal protein L19 [Deltaproteobacteria bacterium]
MTTGWSKTPRPARHSAKEAAVKKYLLDLVERREMKQNIPEFRPGDTIRVHQRIFEGEKERVQVFEGVVIRHRKAGNRSSITVRKISYGVGVEKIFPIHAPTVEKIEIVQRSTSRRAKLYYLRNLAGKAARLTQEKAKPATE